MYPRAMSMCNYMYCVAKFVQKRMRFLAICINLHLSMGHSDRIMSDSDNERDFLYFFGQMYSD